jgi:hypothetical protein
MDIVLNWELIEGICVLINSWFLKYPFFWERVRLIVFTIKMRMVNPASQQSLLSESWRKILIDRPFPHFAANHAVSQ